ncbi:MAG: sigma-54-dependent Fis family transcriptional regulator [Deltaproteobacteria bacterium]|nr:sigma-54-dependent Fis family transcriptional regulator [Deltaproteobacteria bacterium]
MKDLDWTSYDVLVVDDESDNLDAFRFAFRKSFRLHYALGGPEALSVLAKLEPAVIVADQRMPEMSGIELLREAKSRFPDAYAILLTAYADLEVLIDAVNSGAVDRYVQKPWDSKEFALVMRQGIQSWVTLRENRRLREQLAQYAGYLEKQQRDPIDFGQIVGGGTATQRVLDEVAEVAPTTTPVLIEGERGLEKDVVARAIHVGSPREDKPFVSVTCAAFHGQALERELFGYRQGSFEGAYQDRAGRFELADGGTLYLHELSELEPSFQARLLRALASGEVERVGETTSRHVDVRLIVSVSPNLGEVLVGQEVLPDLLSRLRVYPVTLAPLRHRPEDVRPLAEHFLRKYAQRNARAATSMAAETLTRLAAYDWPGNVRELENVVERAAILARGDVIQLEHLMFQDVLTSQGKAPSTPPSEPPPAGVTLSHRLDAIERRELIRALDKYGGNKAEVARALGIHRTTLYYRLKKLGIDV